MVARSSFYVVFSDLHPKEFKLNRLVADTVPVPECHYFSASNEVTGNPYILMDFVEGQRLESVIEAVDEDGLRQLASALAEAALAIHSFKFDRYGFLDCDLHVQHPIDLGAEGLLAFARECLIDKNGRTRLGEELSFQALDFMTQQGSVLADWTGPPCLAHCDFGATNILVSKQSGRWKVSAVLDWEFAFSGTPFMDFGNLLRDPLGAKPGFVECFHQAYIACGGTLPESWRQISLLTDLSAWYEFVTREEAGAELLADARLVIGNTIKSWPEGGRSKVAVELRREGFAEL